MGECLNRSQEPSDTQVALHEIPKCASCSCGALLSMSPPKHSMRGAILSLSHTGRERDPGLLFGVSEQAVGLEHPKEESSLPKRV